MNKPGQFTTEVKETKDRAFRNGLTTGLIIAVLLSLLAAISF